MCNRVYDAVQLFKNDGPTLQATAAGSDAYTAAHADNELFPVDAKLQAIFTDPIPSLDELETVAAYCASIGVANPDA